MNNVIDMFTRKYVVSHSSELDKYNGTWLEPVADICRRLDRPMSKVLFEPREDMELLVNSKGLIYVDSYEGNVHTGRGCNPFPMPANIDKYIETIKNKQAKKVVLTDNCFMHMDRKYKVTQRFLKRIKECPSVELIVIGTLSDLYAHDTYLKLLIDTGIEIEIRPRGMNFTDSENNKMYPGAPSKFRRKKALDKAMSVLNKTKLKKV